MSKKKKSKNKKIGKVNPIFYALARAFLHRSFTKKYNITYDNAIVKEIKGPAIVVGTHTCDQDHILSALTLYPIRPTYIVSEHFIRNKKTARLLKLMHVITKKMFTPDVSTIMNILRAKKEDAVIVIFPEGRLSSYGRTLPVTEGTAELIKKLGVNLYAWRAEGAYLTFPKWRNKGDNRPGKINSSVKLLLSADEVVVYDCICFDLELIWDADIKTGLINNTLSVKKLIDRENLCTENMQEWISVSCDACENGHPGWELEAIGCISMLIGCLKKHGYFTTELRGKKETEFIQKVMCYISDHYSSHITSSTAATALYMNNSYFCRAFKKAFDCRFSDYLQAYRLEKARICLSNTNDSITDIAFRSGFNGCSYFSQVFKEHFGISPITYRKEWARRYSAQQKRKW